MGRRIVVVAASIVVGVGCQVIVGIDSRTTGGGAGSSSSGAGGDGGDGQCRADQRDCIDGRPSVCVNGAWVASQTSCNGDTPWCASGTCVGAKCAGLASTCGQIGIDSCCSTQAVPGGTYLRSYDAVTHTTNTFTATVSAFDLDVYEITVGRFRSYVAGFPANTPSPGTGKNPHNTTDPGWKAEWNAQLPTSREAFIKSLHCNPERETWTDAPGANELKPMNCITWYEAYAACIWENKRLPTEAEWNFVAAGGSDQRVYPWSLPANDTVLGELYASYGGAPISIVGIKAKGNSKWGHADLSGNVSEFVLDKLVEPYAITPCTDCAQLPTGDSFVTRGGNFQSAAGELFSAARTPAKEARSAFVGARCAR